jgi:hypothetical protein
VLSAMPAVIELVQWPHLQNSRYVEDHAAVTADQALLS